MDITLLEDIIREQDKEDIENQKSKINNSKFPNPNLPKEDEELTLTTDLPIMNFAPEQPIMIEQNISVIMVVVLNDPKIEKTIQVINTAVKNRKVTGVVYGVSDVTNVQEFKDALEAQKLAQEVPVPEEIPDTKSSEEEFTGAPTEEPVE